MVKDGVGCWQAVGRHFNLAVIPVNASRNRGGIKDPAVQAGGRERAPLPVGQVHDVFYVYARALQ